MGAQRVDQDHHREELLELYKLALEDYRFQVQLNQDRSRYFLVLNLTVIGIATGLVQIGPSPTSILVAVLYLTGALFCVFSIVALKMQRKFYRSARDQKRYFEERLMLGETSITPVDRASGFFAKVITFKGFVNFMFVVLAAFNLFSAFFVAFLQ